MFCRAWTEQCAVDWTAVSAIATAAAVMVALLPVGHEWWRRRRLGANLRRLLRDELLKIDELVVSRSSGNPVLLAPDDVRPLEALLRDAVEVISAAEFSAVSNVVQALLRERSIPGGGTTPDLDFLALTQAARSALGFSKVAVGYD